MKLAVLTLGLWLAGAQGFAAQACCSEMPAPKAACGDCGNQTSPDPSPRPDCCTSLEAQKDVDLAGPRTELNERIVAVEFLTEDTTFAPWRPDASALSAVRAVSLAEDLPLYLRNSVLLI